MKVRFISVLCLFLSGCMLAANQPAGSPDEQSDSVEIWSSPPDETRSTRAQVEPLSSPTPPLVNLDDYGIAPELNNQVWLNVPGPLRLADLRGEVVLLDMWTFG